jgi:hypothetical protein
MGSIRFPLLGAAVVTPVDTSRDSLYDEVLYNVVKKIVMDQQVAKLRCIILKISSMFY